MLLNPPNSPKQLIVSEQTKSDMAHKSKLPQWSVGEIKAAYKRNPKCAIDFKITSSRDADQYVRSNISTFMEELEWREHFGAIFLSRNNKVIGHKIISSGGVAGTVADPKIIFQHALICNASSIILFHNHPSGNTTPSKADISLTNKLVQAGSFLDINVLDHLIITDLRYFSFADEGKI